MFPTTQDSHQTADAMNTQRAQSPKFLNVNRLCHQMRSKTWECIYCEWYPILSTNIASPQRKHNDNRTQQWNKEQTPVTEGALQGRKVKESVRSWILTNHTGSPQVEVKEKRLQGKAVNKRQCMQSEHRERGNAKHYGNKLNNMGD